MDLQDFLDRLTHVKRSGSYWTASCPGHEDHRNSLSVKQMPNGKLSVTCYAGCSIEDILSPLGLKPSDLYPPDPARNQKPDIVATYDYTDEQGRLLYQVVRYVPKDFRQRRPDGSGWAWNLKDTRRVLFHLPAVLSAIEAGKKIFLVEGEKDVLSLGKLGLTATTNCGGCKAWRREYDTVLRTASAVICIPDNDEPGQTHMRAMVTALPNAYLLELPGLRPGGDVSDWIQAGGTREALITLARDAIQERQDAPQQALSAQGQSDTPAPPETPYRALGHAHQRFYFLSSRSEQVCSFSSNNLRNKLALHELAPQLYWEEQYEADYTAAAESVMERCYQVGPFREEHRRGRGAWIDAERVVLHQGDRLIVNGESHPLAKFSTGYIYERAIPMRIPHTAPASTTDAAGLANLCNALPWESSVAGQLLAGWLVLAPICGALRWRPHIWVTGPAGCGKTWVIDNIVGTNGLLGDVALQVQSVTTEAGLRQALGHDARPVIFDEAELDDERGQANMQRVLELARQASSDSGAIIAKGTAAGQALTFSVRSAFCLSSISIGVRRRADETRVTVLAMRGNSGSREDEAAFADLERQQEKICHADFAAALIARSVQMAPIIRANAHTFAIAVARKLNSRRTGDQLGALLSGYWSLWSDLEIPLDEAVEYVAGLGLEDLSPDESRTDEQRCLQHILEQRVRVQSERISYERTIGELIEDTRRPTVSGVDKLASQTLQRYGIRADFEDGLVIANTHSGTAGLLKNTPWLIGWAPFLRRLEGASVPKRTFRFAGGKAIRVTLIPWNSVYGEQSEESTAAPQIQENQEYDEQNLPF